MLLNRTIKGALTIFSFHNRNLVVVISNNCYRNRSCEKYHPRSITSLYLKFYGAIVFTAELLRTCMLPSCLLDCFPGHAIGGSSNSFTLNFSFLKKCITIHSNATGASGRKRPPMSWERKVCRGAYKKGNWAGIKGNGDDKKSLYGSNVRDLEVYQL